MSEPEGLPERIGMVIGAIVTIGAYALVAWPVLRTWLY